jgi:hypothetical protein
MAQNGGIGIMLVIMLVAVIFTALALAITEFRIGLKHLKKVLHNFDILYPGCIPPIVGLDCVASFPCKYAQGWAKVVRLGRNRPSSGRHTAAEPTNENEKQAAESAQLSVACVFFTPRKCTSCEGNILSYPIH